jgi:RNA polymerase sigma-70 factor (ECF subfamily)
MSRIVYYVHNFFNFLGYNQRRKAYLFSPSYVLYIRGNMVSDHEQARLRRARALDRAALAAIYDDYHQPVYRYVYRQVGDGETARDLVSEVFHRFLQAMQRGSGPDRYLAAWLYRTAHNIVVDHYRRQQHRRHLPLDEELVNATDDPAGTAEHRLSVAQVRAALQCLTPDQQQVISLKFLEGLSNQEVADVLGKPIGAVKSLQHRALAALQRQLAPDKENIPS